MVENTVNLIQAILAPGIMISACGLLLLGTNNKYSLVVNRIRALDEEKRKMLWNKELTDLNTKENKRLSNIQQQLQLFYSRIRFVRNAVFSYTTAVALFITTSLLIGLYKEKFALITFLLGMLFVLIGSLFMLREIIVGYKIVKIEVSSI